MTNFSLEAAQISTTQDSSARLENLMKLAIAALLLFGAITQTNAQQALGFTPNDTPGPTVKLDGLVVQRVSGGYLVLSVPPKDIIRFIELAKTLEPHLAILDVLERLDEESKKLVPVAGSFGTPLGTCFLATDEIFPHHKILDRNVQQIGTFTFLNRREKAVTVPAYSGGPTK
jgi:hypothetical protein